MTRFRRVFAKRFAAVWIKEGHQPATDTLFIDGKRQEHHVVQPN